MSIVIGAATLADEALLPLWMLVGLAISLSMTAALRVFAPRRVLGPPRVSPDEPLGRLLAVLGIGVLSWLVLPLMYGAFRPHAPQPVAAASQPTTTTMATTTTATADAEPVTTAPSPDTTVVASKAAGTKLTPTEIVFLSAGQGIGALIGLLVGTVAIRPRGLERVGLRWRSLPVGLAKGLLAILVCLPLVLIATNFTELLWERLNLPHAQEHDLLKILGQADSTVLRIATVVAASVIAPLSEELLFRGYLQTIVGAWLRRRWAPGPADVPPALGFDPIFPASSLPPTASASAPRPAGFRSAPAWPSWVAILVTSLVFASLHPWWSIPPIFVLALCLGYAYERTGNLWVTIFMHSMFNSLMVAVFLSQQS